MHSFHILLVFLTWVASVRLEDPAQIYFKAKATVSLGNPIIFSGEDVQLECVVPDAHPSGWTFQWFHDGEIVSSNKVYNIRKARIQQSGDYTCQGRQLIKIWPHTKTANLSEPLKLHVDGGWILLRATSESLITEEPMTLTCRIRDNPLLVNAIFYKDNVKFKSQNSHDLVFPSAAIEDNGIYSCRATWVKNLVYQSAQSSTFHVNVLERLETPRLVVTPDQDQVRIGTLVVFRCITKVNAREQGLTVEYYYLKDDNRLGPASSSDTYVISRVNGDDAGTYTCRVYLRALDTERWSNAVELKVPS